MKYIRKIMAILGMTGILAVSNCNYIYAAEADATTAVSEEVTVESEDAEELTTIEEEETALADNFQNATMVKKYATTTHVKNFGYWVYRPTDSTEKELPLIVYMHGISERGNNLDTLLRVSLPMHLYQKNVSVNAVVIMPQCPSSTNWTNLADDVMELINIVKEEENIDDTSISLTGHSLGGIGTWKIALKYPDVFASLVPVSSTINTPAEAVKLVDIPIWSLHGTKDTMSPSSMLQAQKYIEAAGGTKMQVTLFQGMGHCITDVVYNNPDLDVLNWMARQHRNTNVDSMDDPELAQ